MMSSNAPMKFWVLQLETLPSVQNVCASQKGEIYRPVRGGGGGGVSGATYPEPQGIIGAPRYNRGPKV